MDEIKRIDPRQQRLLRNRLHPEHDAVVSAVSVSASGLLRKNPHQQGYLSAEGIKRIDRSGAAAQMTGQAKKAQAAALPLRSVTNPTDYIVVFSDADSEKLTVMDKDMLGLAHQLANDSTSVLLITLHLRSDDLGGSGADRVLVLGNGEQFAPDTWLATFQAIHDSLNVRHWIMADGSLVGGHLARLLAAELGVRPITRGKLFADGALTCGGGDPALQVQRELSPVMLVEEQVADPISGFVSAAQAVHCADNAACQTVTDLGRVAVDPAHIPLAETRFILSAGNGVHNWALYHQCAKALGATEGASRVAVDNGNMPRATQVGATGTYVNAKVYIAVGISGAIQHLQGMTHCETVIAINADPNCDMVKRADLSVIADSSEVMQALVDAVSNNRKGEWEHAG